MSLRTEYERLQPSGHWFDADSMRFFGTGLEAERWFEDCVLFVTSEKPPHRPRAWSVRRMDRRTGDITNVGEFCSLTRAEANAVLKRGRE